MRVTQGFRARPANPGPKVHGTWGNSEVERMLGEFPYLIPLVRELQAEQSWSQPHRDDADGWVALFFIDYVEGRRPKITLHMKPSRRTLQVPGLRIRFGRVPNIHDIQRHVLQTIRRVPRERIEQRNPE